MDDLISREQAIQKMVDLFQEDVEMYGAEIPECFDSDRAEEALRELPSIDAVPVVKCNDCKYARMTYDGECKYCDVWFPDEAEYLDGDYYCASAERKES